MTSSDSNSEAPAAPGIGRGCPDCGYRGWKFRLFRRSVASAGDAGERALLTRARVACLACTPPTGQGGACGE